MKVGHVARQDGFRACPHDDLSVRHQNLDVMSTFGDTRGREAVSRLVSQVNLPARCSKED